MGAEKTKDARSIGGDGGDDGSDDGDAQKVTKYKKKLAKAEKKGVDAAEIREIKKKLEKYEARMEKKTVRKVMQGEPTAEQGTKHESDDDIDVEWYTDASPEAVSARRAEAL